MMVTKILLKDMLKDIHEHWGVAHNHYVRKYGEGHYKPLLTMRRIASEISVTPATLTNLTVDSKFSLIYDIALTIYDYYYQYYQEKEYYINNHLEDGEKPITIDVYYVIKELTFIYIDYIIY